MTAQPQTHQHQLVDHAVAYGRAGLPVFPLNPRTKQPYVSWKLASCDEVTVRSWWAKFPNAAIGHRILPGYVILDIDPRHGGDQTWLGLLAGDDSIEPARRHHSGRGDGGFHAWYRLDDHEGRLTIKPLDQWARDHGVGQQLEGGRWTCGIDILHHDQRYTILPPSPYPSTGGRYEWDAKDEPERLPDGLAGLILAPLAVVADEPEYDSDDVPEGVLTIADIEHPDSVADWYSSSQSWPSILGRHGWTIASGDGNSDGSTWKHPKAASEHDHSASIRHGLLFVYSSATAFEPSADGDPHGYTRFAAYTLLDHEGDGKAAARAARELRAPSIVDYQPSADSPSIFLDWSSFAERDASDRRWLVEGLWPWGRAVALWAAAKAGKSELALWCAARLAMGLHPWTGKPIEPVDVAYFDYEMTEDDLEERLDDFGFDVAQLGRLHYALLPPLSALDSDAGGQQIEGLALSVGASAVVIDTFGRAVSGDENEADTVRAFYRHTGSRLKRQGIASLRTDHAGKDSSKGQRGSSAKRDDVDVVWSQKRTKGGVLLDCHESTRLSWCGPTLTLDRTVSPSTGLISYSTPLSAGWGWLAGTAAKAKQLDDLGIDPALGRGKVVEAIKAAGQVPGNKQVLDDAIKYRRDPQAKGPEAPAQASGQVAGAGLFEFDEGQP